MLTESDILAGVLDDACRGRGRALVLQGRPAAAETGLLARAEEAATAAGMRVLQARGSAQDRESPFAGLHRLLEPALHRIDRLPRTHAAALRGALGLGGPPDDRHLIGIAVLHLLGDLADERPVLVLLDDAHRLDHASREALALVGRR
ncbi:MAG TPA: AAA family ATPase, partial [Candidatus Dormibacteraeota bacterium]|nr:AAA family ATPase [Candidatus Dormibacteraeota bacterium]